MKKLFILLNYFFIFLSIAAQKTSVKNIPNDNFCNALSKVIAQASGQFENLKTGGYLTFLNPGEAAWVGEGWGVSMNFPGAFTSFIGKEENRPNSYIVYFGTYRSQTEAQKEAGAIKNKLSACLPAFTIEDRGYMDNNVQGFPINFFFIEKKKGISPQQIVNLYLVKDSSLHNLYLRIIGSDVNGTILQSIMAKPVEAPNGQSSITNTQVRKFDEQLSSIVADYANEFATIKGAMKTTGSGGNFYSIVELQGADSVYLTQNWTTQHLDFIAVYPGYSSKEEARAKFNELVAQVDKCRFPCCTFAKTGVSEYSNMVVQGWLPLDLEGKMKASYEKMLLEVEIHKGFVIDEKSEKIAIKDVWQLVLRVKKL